MAGEYGGMMPGHFPGAFPGMPPGGPDGHFGGPPAGLDSWGGGGGEEMAQWGPRDGGMMPPGNIMPGMGHPMMMGGRGRGGFGGRGLEGMPGRGGSGRFGGRGGSHWGPPEEGFEGPGGWSAQGMGEAPSMPGRGFHGRAPDPGRGRGAPPAGRRGGRAPGGWPARGGPRSEEWAAPAEAEPRPPSQDAVLAERRRASAAALLRAQVSQLQVSRELLGDAPAAEAYSRVMAGEGPLPERPDARRLYTFLLFAAEEQGAAPAAADAEEPDAAHAFEQCLLLYQQAQAGCAVVQSEHGSFLMREP